MSRACDDKVLRAFIGPSYEEQELHSMQLKLSLCLHLVGIAWRFTENDYVSSFYCVDKKLQWKEMWTQLSIYKALIFHIWH